MSVDIFSCHNLEDATGIQAVEARDIAKHGTKYRQPPKTKNYPVPNVTSAKDEKSCPTRMTIICISKAQKVLKYCGYLSD